MALYGQHMKQVSPHHSSVQSSGPSVMGQATVFEQPKGSVLPWCNPWCHLQEHKESPCLHLPVPLFAPFLGWLLGLRHLSCPWGTQRMQRGRGRRACPAPNKHFQRSLWSTDGALELSKGLLREGRAGRQHCVCCTGHIHGNKGREAKRPLQSQQSRLFTSLFVRSFRLKTLEQIYTSKCTQEVGKLNMNTRPTGCSVQETENGINPLNWRPKHRLCPVELPSGVPSHPSAGLHGGEAVGNSSGGLDEGPTRSGPPAQNCPSTCKGWAAVGTSIRQLVQKENKALGSTWSTWKFTKTALSPNTKTLELPQKVPLLDPAVKSHLSGNAAA